jgi:hypothetical protein
MVSARPGVISRPSRRRFEAQTAEMSVDTPDGRTDTRFPRLRCLRHDRLLRSILLRFVHRTGTVCARTFWSFDSPLRFRPFQSTSPITSIATMDLARLLFNRNDSEGTYSPRWSVFQGYIISTDCMPISKPRFVVSTRLSKVLRLSSTTQVEGQASAG